MTQRMDKLVDNAFKALPLGSIRPSGWLLRQLQLQASGLAGHLDEFWPDVSQSGWIGGNSEGWERGPYWLDGLVPLAFLLDDARLKTKVHAWSDAILTKQGDDGWLGPVQDTTRARSFAYDPWPVSVALKGLMQYQEATGDPRVMPAFLRFFRVLQRQLEHTPCNLGPGYAARNWCSACSGHMNEPTKHGSLISPRRFKRRDTTGSPISRTSAILIGKTPGRWKPMS